MQINFKQLSIFKRNSLAYSISTLITGVCGLLTFILYARFFSPDEFGEYTLYYGLVSLISAVLINWLAQAVLRYDHEYSQNMGMFNTTVLTVLVVINLVFTLISSIVILLLYPHLELEQANMLLFSALLFISQGIYQVTGMYLRSRNNSIHYSINEIVIALARIFLVYFLINYTSLRASSIILSLFISTTSVSIFNLIRLKLIQTYKISKFSMDITQEMFKYGIPLLGIYATNWVLSLSDRYFIKLYATSYDVGVYSFSYTLGSTIMSLVTNFLMLGAFPLIIKVWNPLDKSAAESITSRLAKIYLAISMPALFGIYIIKDHLYKILDRPAYFQGSGMVLIVSFSLFLSGLSSYYNKIWELNKKTSVLMIMNIIAAFLNIILNIIFIPMLGYQTAAYTTLASYVFYFISSIIVNRGKFVVKIEFSFLLRIIISSVIMFIPAYLVSISISNSIPAAIFAIITGLIIYSCTLFIQRKHLLK